MEPYLDKSDAPGEWTTRQVICHLLFEQGWDPVAVLKSFSTSNLPVIEINGGLTDTGGPRQTASLKQLLDMLDLQRKAIYGYLEGLSDADLKRKAHPAVQAAHGERGSAHTGVRRRALRLSLERSRRPSSPRSARRPAPLSRQGRSVARVDWSYHRKG